MEIKCRYMIMLVVMVLLLGFAVYTQSVSRGGESALEVAISMKKQTHKEFQLQINVKNISGTAIYICTRPRRVDRSSGFYFSVDPSERQTLIISNRVFPPVVYSPYSVHTDVQLQTLGPKKSFSFLVGINFPLKETIPPIQDPNLSKVISIEILKKVTVEVGFFREDFGMNELLKSKPFGWTVNGNEKINTGSSAGKRLYEIQELGLASVDISPRLYAMDYMRRMN